MPSSVVSSTTPNGKLVEGDGRATYALLKWMQNIGTTINAGFDVDGNYQGPIGTRATIAGRETLASIVQNIDVDGIVEAAGIDFARAYVNKDTDHIADGAGSPLAGGKAAYIALVTNAPVVTPKNWLTGLVGGVFAKSQPAFGDLSGAATAAQVPPLSGLSGQITFGQLPSAGMSVVIVTAALTIAGATGSMTFQNGILTAQVPAT